MVYSLLEGIKIWGEREENETEDTIQGRSWCGALSSEEQGPLIGDVTGLPTSITQGERVGMLAYRSGLFLTPVYPFVSVANVEDASTSGFGSQNEEFDLNSLLTPRA